MTASIIFQARIPSLASSNVTCAQGEGVSETQHFSVDSCKQGNLFYLTITGTSTLQPVINTALLYNWPLSISLHNTSSDIPFLPNLYALYNISNENRNSQGKIIDERRLFEENRQRATFYQNK